MCFLERKFNEKCVKNQGTIALNEIKTSWSRIKFVIYHFDWTRSFIIKGFWGVSEDPFVL